MSARCIPFSDYASVRPVRVAAVQAFGLTERQARFLTHVLVFSGVFLERQYCQFAGTRACGRRSNSADGRSRHRSAT